MELDEKSGDHKDHSHPVGKDEYLNQISCQSIQWLFRYFHMNHCGLGHPQSHSMAKNLCF